MISQVHSFMPPYLVKCLCYIWESCSVIFLVFMSIIYFFNQAMNRFYCPMSFTEAELMTRFIPGFGMRIISATFNWCVKYRSKQHKDRMWEFFHNFGSNKVLAGGFIKAEFLNSWRDFTESTFFDERYLLLRDWESFYDPVFVVKFIAEFGVNTLDKCFVNN